MAWPGEDTPLSLTVRLFAPKEIEFEFEYPGRTALFTLTAGQATWIGGAMQEVERLIRERLNRDASDATHAQ